MKIRTIFSKRKIPVSAWLALGVVERKKGRGSFPRRSGNEPRPLSLRLFLFGIDSARASMGLERLS